MGDIITNFKRNFSQISTTFLLLDLRNWKTDKIGPEAKEAVNGLLAKVCPDSSSSSKEIPQKTNASPQLAVPSARIVF